MQIPKTPPPASPAPLRSVPTSADKARLAGVSRATVSYVLIDVGRRPDQRAHWAPCPRGREGTRVRAARGGPQPARRAQPHGADARAGLPRRPALQPVHHRPPGGARAPRLHGRAVRHRRPAGRRGRPRLGRAAARGGPGPRLRARPTGRRAAQALRGTGRRHPRTRDRRGRVRPAHGPRRRRPRRGHPPLRPGPAPDRRRRPAGTRSGGVLRAPPGRGARGPARHGRHGHRAAPRPRRGRRRAARRPLARPRPRRRVHVQRRVRDAPDARPSGRGHPHPGGDRRGGRRQPDAGPVAAAPAEHRPPRTAVGP
ncbi:LacI-family transcriptional regulator [Streptomyces viridosporus ATCC 14672]|uniref:LacI-family transcriptional regulator n=1 Tax=Streptomyces viridosporus (strain ATCC 14672 / DSM 40746 / JCM 4963 / KCTC 9882 / NRRL B-12104 / FH 1290) TaxID=566461 RepID=D6A036_STRV1|nr:LacI-family transcriptional regulator [Streptomyces viridosporus ATCC 14672]